MKVNADNGSSRFDDALRHVESTEQIVEFVRGDSVVAVLITARDFTRLQTLEDKLDLTLAVAALKQADRLGSVMFDELTEQLETA